MPSPRVSDDRGLATLIERRMRNYELSRSHRASSGVEEEAPAIQDFVTISRMVGSGGREIAEMLSRRLDWPMFDRDLLRAMARDDKLREMMYENMDERDLGWFEEIFRSVMQMEFRKNDYFHRLTEMVFYLARSGNAVFIGRAADLILPRDTGFRVGLVASKESCCRRHAERMNIDIEVARLEVRTKEQERLAWLRKNFPRICENPGRHDLVINTDRFSFEDIVDMIVSAKQRKRPES